LPIGQAERTKRFVETPRQSPRGPLRMQAQTMVADMKDRFAGDPGLP
jgi:hypothetical protein